MRLGRYSRRPSIVLLRAPGPPPEQIITCGVQIEGSSSVFGVLPTDIHFHRYHDGPISNNTRRSGPKKKRTQRSRPICNWYVGVLVLSPGTPSKLAFVLSVGRRVTSPEDFQDLVILDCRLILWMFASVADWLDLESIR